LSKRGSMSVGLGEPELVAIAEDGAHLGSKIMVSFVSNELVHLALFRVEPQLWICIRRAV